jgi:hypothetical protein
MHMLRQFIAIAGEHIHSAGWTRLELKSTIGYFRETAIELLFGVLTSKVNRQRAQRRDREY